MKKKKFKWTIYKRKANKYTLIAIHRSKTFGNFELFNDFLYKRFGLKFKS